MNILRKLFFTTLKKSECSFLRLADCTDEHFYKREHKDGFNLYVYKYSLESYQCLSCGKVRRTKDK